MQLLAMHTPFKAQLAKQLHPKHLKMMCLQSTCTVSNWMGIASKATAHKANLTKLLGKHYEINDMI